MLFEKRILVECVGFGVELAAHFLIVEETLCVLDAPKLLWFADTEDDGGALSPAVPALDDDVTFVDDSAGLLFND